MQGWKCLSVGFIFLSLTACSKSSFLKADCNTCTTEEQEWKGFSWSRLDGSWKGNVEVTKNDRNTVKRTKESKKVEIRFLEAATFLKSKGIEACGSLPADAWVMNGVLWERISKTSGKEFEVFAKGEESKAAYGRLVLDRVNGVDICRFQRFGRVMSQNRLALPTVAFSEGGSAFSRGLASVEEKKYEVNVEFLRFDPASMRAQEFKPDSRAPASAYEVERPPLMFRVFRIASQKSGDKEEWQSTEESIYRLWRTK